MRKSEAKQSSLSVVDILSFMFDGLLPYNIIEQMTTSDCCSNCAENYVSFAKQNRYLSFYKFNFRPSMPPSASDEETSKESRHSNSILISD